MRWLLGWTGGPPARISMLMSPCLLYKSEGPRSNGRPTHAAGQSKLARARVWLRRKGRDTWVVGQASWGRCRGAGVSPALPRIPPAQLADQGPKKQQEQRGLSSLRRSGEGPRGGTRSKTLHRMRTLPRRKKTKGGL